MFTRSVLFGTTLALLGGAVSAGKPVTYRGTGSYVLTRAILPLANGDAVMQLIHDTIATIEPSESGFIYGDEEDSATVEIIGGSGKWTGATGAGIWKRKWGQDYRGTYEYEITITTP